MPRFHFEELIGENDALPGGLSDGGARDAEMATEVPEMGSLLGASTPQVSRQPPLSASRSSLAVAPTPSPQIVRPISRRIQSAPRPPVQGKPAGPALSISFQSPLRLPPTSSVFSAATPAALGFRTSPAPAVAHRAPQPVTPAYPTEPAVALDSGDSWRNDAGLFLGRSFRACFSPSGELFMPASVRGAVKTGGGHRVAVVPLKGRLFKQRNYGEMLQVHRDMRASVEGVEGADAQDLMQAIAHYRDTANRLVDKGGSRQQAESVFSLLQALSKNSSKGVLQSFSDWLKTDAARAAESALGDLDPSRKGSAYDEVFVRLSARQMDEACEAALNNDKMDLALLLAQIGEHTSLCQDMQKQVEWLQSRCGTRVDNGEDAEAAKLMQLYRLLAGDVDELLRRMAEDVHRDAARVPGGMLLDWKRCFALYLWYEYPDEMQLVLPPEGMSCKKGADLFQVSRRRFSLQGAFQYYMSLLRQNRHAPLEDPIVCHPWPAYIEASDTRICQPSVLRSVVKCVPSRPCAQLPPAVLENALASMSEGKEPGNSVLKAHQSAMNASQTFLREDWPVDICFHLIHMLFPSVCGQDTSLARALSTQTHSGESFDFELSWHVQQVFEAMLCASFPPPHHPPPVFQLAKRHRTTPAQRCLLTSHFATQLEMAGNWQLACYVVVAAAWDNRSVGDPDTARDMETFAATALRGLLCRNIPARGDGTIGVGGGLKLTTADIALRLHKGEDEVKRWFAEARAWRVRYEKGAGVSLRRIFQDEELALSVEAGDWERAHDLLLDLLVADDVEHAVKPPERTLKLMRHISANMIRTHKADVWDKGAGPILELLEMWEQFTHFGTDGEDDLEPGAILRIAGKAQAACERIGKLRMSTQRAVVGLCLKVSQSVWAYQHLGSEGPGWETPGGWERGSASLVTQLHLPPSNQLSLLQQLAAKTLDGMRAQLHDGILDNERAAESEDGMDFETEEC
mmetsp:Transcript_8915/g.22255  ORF Transcript_8915/g.22255 Transcript_8915/m.22255 type:complete len:969 (-) Transcript_8915:190-3096(-)